MRTYKPAMPARVFDVAFEQSWVKAVTAGLLSLKLDRMLADMKALLRQ